MKIAPIMSALDSLANVNQSLVHTGQHHDPTMSKVFFDDLGIPHPDVDLGIGSDSHGAQTGRMMVELERVFRDLRSNCAVVVGDVNSTMAAALVAVKLGIPCAHVEAGLRSFDRSMPEEIKRMVTDRVAHLLLTRKARVDGFRRTTGGDHSAWDSLPHPSHDHRTPGHCLGRDEHRRWVRPRSYSG